MVEKIDLSGYGNRGFSKAGFKELIEGLSEMRCLTTLVL